jgi:hypothetical protein
MKLMVEVSLGEVLDKITILQIKQERIADPAKVANVRKELQTLEGSVGSSGMVSPQIRAVMTELREINEALWDIEDDIRECERQKNFGEEFVRLARAVYFTNDRRAAAKHRINTMSGSRLVEEKSYAAY